MKRDNHDALIDAYTTALNRWMKIVDRKNGYKRPISQEPDTALSRGRDQEQREVERGYLRVRQFGTCAEKAIGHELADYNRYALEELRRIGAVTCQPTRSGSLREAMRSLSRTVGAFPRSFARTTRRPLRRSRRSERSRTTRDERCG